MSKNRTVAEIEAAYPYSGIRDLRTVIAPEDVVTYTTTKEALTIDDINTSEIDAEGTVIAVYPAFAIVRLRVIEDTANRWEIKSVRKGGAAK